MADEPPIRIKCIACPVFYRELCLMASRSPNIVDLGFLDAELHGLGCKETCSAIQTAIDQTSAEKKYDAIVLGYGRCNGGLGGLRAGEIPLVIPRVHDCISMFLGSVPRYLQVFADHPSTYYLTSGWMERNMKDGDELHMPMLQAGGDLGGIQAGSGMEYDRMVEKYGPDNAEYLRDFFSRWKENYTRLAYIRMGVFDESGLIGRAREIARRHGWDFDLVEGGWSLFESLFAGGWGEEFLVVGPGKKVVLKDDSGIIGVD